MNNALVVAVIVTGVILLILGIFIGLRVDRTRGSTVDQTREASGSEIAPARPVQPAEFAQPQLEARSSPEATVG